MPGTRNAFSLEDDKYLVKYISTYNPMVSGRRGNALYQRLCENADQRWPWSIRHPWASWRDRYCKNSERFDVEIRKYIKKHNLPEDVEKTDGGVFLRKRARESEGAASGGNEGDGSDTRARKRKRKRVPDNGDDRQVKIKQEPVDSPKVVLRKSPEEQPKPSMAHTERGRKTVVKEEEEESSEAEAKPEVENSNASDGGGMEEKDEGDREDGDEEVGQGSEPVGSDDYTQDIFQSVPPIVTEDVSETDTESDKEEDELGETQPNMKTSEQHNGPPLYPDISTLSSPRFREQKLLQPDSNRRTFTKASSPPVSRQRTRSSPEPIASTSKVQLSPSHRLPRGSSLLRDTRPKRKVPKDDDFFASVPPTPTPSSPSPPRLVKRQPPQLIEGAFRNTFVDVPQGGRDDTSDDGEKPVWPPMRKKKISGSQSPDKRQLETGVNVRAKEVTPNGGRKSVFQPRYPTEQAAPKDGQASHPMSLPLKPPKPEHQPQKINGTPVDQESPKGATAQRGVSKIFIPIEQASKTRGGLPATTPGHQTADRKPQREKSSTIALTRKSGSKQEPHLPTAGSRVPALQTSSHIITLGGPSRRSSGLRHEAKLVDHAPPVDSHTPGNPFKAHPEPVGESKGKSRVRASSLFDRRHTIDYASEGTSPTVRRDLRSQSFREPRQSLPAPTHTPMVTSTPDKISQPSLLPIPIAAEDRFKVEYLGMSAAVTIIAKRFSVAEEVVWRGWEKTKSISKTEEYCRRLAELNAKSEAIVLKEMRKSGIISEETPTHTPRSTAGSPRSRRSSGKRKLEIKPLVDDDVMSEYTPPSSTRAAQYARLAKQGRKEEALTREWRRASFGGLKGSFSYRQSDPEYSSPARKTYVDHVEEGPGETPPPTTPSLSASGDYGEDALDDALEDLDEEAFLTTTAQNAEALREIERGVDPDLMFQWAAALLGQVRDRASQLPQDNVG
ncbi:hypothetical protein BDZ94DRAFT_1258778 [Collybia nuda]|uniref:TERF2-interacting telomeric protein 1 Myb domain-containing protein n=1 Tax=Collybia nuda TaxID=64659 RepID=A0A9P5Y8V8_9AGAR|nr:hypothetical protein BDZ94DRAFT_1258778 [Collybia nuda]